MPALMVVFVHLDPSSRQNTIHLYEAIAAGLGRWIATYVGDHAQFLEFVERYDLTVSDQRLAQSEKATSLVPCR